MKLSVIVPCLDASATIATQLEALASQQSSNDWEVIVVNSGSTDGSIATVKQYRDRLPNLRIVDASSVLDRRSGTSHAYNVGIKAATGDAFIFCEAGDEVAPGWLAAMAQALLDHEFVACRLEYRKLNEAWRVADYGEGFQATSLPRRNYPPFLPFAESCSFGLRRSVYEAIGEFNPVLPHHFDADYCWRAQFAGIEIHYVPDALVHHRLLHRFDAVLGHGYSYGKDMIVLRKYYRNPLGKLGLVRAIRDVMLLIPNGVWLFLQLLWRGSPAKSKFVMWLWTFGFNAGEVEGFIQKLPISLQQDPAASSAVSKLSVQTSS